MNYKFSGFFLPKLKKMETEKFVFNAVAFDPIKIWTCLAPQNGHQHLSFVKDYNVVGKKRPKMVKKWPCMRHKFTVFFLSKLKKNGNRKICV